MKKILIIGAGFLQTFVIKKAVSIGYYVLTVDGNPKAEGFKYAHQSKCIDIIDKNACLEYAIEHSIDGVMTAATDFAVTTTSYIAEKMNLLGLNYDVACLVKNKFEVKQKLIKAKVDDSKYVYEVSLDNIELVADKIEYPAIVKPCDGSGSRAISKVSDKYEFRQACLKSINTSLISKAEVEEFVKGYEYGVESLVIDGEVNVLAVMKKLMTNLRIMLNLDMLSLQA